MVDVHELEQGRFRPVYLRAELRIPVNPLHDFGVDVSAKHLGIALFQRRAAGGPALEGVRPSIRLGLSLRFLLPTRVR